MVQFAQDLANATLDGIETAIGTAPILKIRSGSAPANCSTADAGTVLATITLPSDWLDPATGGLKSKAGTWQDASADATGTAGHYRLYASDGVTCKMQGTVGTSGTDLIVDSVSFTSGQTVTVTLWVWQLPV